MQLQSYSWLSLKADGDEVMFPRTERKRMSHLSPRWPGRSNTCSFTSDYYGDKLDLQLMNKYLPFGKEVVLFYNV